MKLKILLFIILFSLVLPQKFVLSADHSDIIINEIAWMGTNTSYNDEWIELYNNTNSSINLDNWDIKAVDGTPEINLSGTIQANGFYLLERTNDDTVPNIAADQIYTGALSNNGEHLQLFDDQNNLIDEINCTDSWLAGDNTTKQTMERIEPTSSNWQTSKNPEGTPKSKNSVFIEEEPEPTPEPAPEPTPEPAPEPEQEIEEQVEEKTYAAGVIFNEILPSPEGRDSENEWIEIFNKNNFNVDLSDWKIKDSIGSITTYVLPKNSIIKSKDYLVVFRPETKIILNNDADSLNLIQPDNAVIDAVSYEKANKGQSYNLTGSGWVWSLEPTPGKANFIKRENDFEDKKVIIKEKTDEIKQNEKILASASSQIPKNNNGLSDLFLMALTISIFSAVIILLLKKAMRKIDFWKIIG